MITCNSHSKSKMEINRVREIGIHLGGKFQYFEWLENLSTESTTRNTR